MSYDEDESHPLDSGIHDSHLQRITDLLHDLVSELKGLRAGVQDLATKLSRPE